MLRLTGDDVVFLSSTLEETCYTFDAHVVALGGAARENNFLGVSADEVGNVFASLFDGLFGLPAVSVGAGVRVAVQSGHEREHGIEHSRVHGRSSLGIEIDGSGALVQDGRLLQDACNELAQLRSHTYGDRKELPAAGLIMASALMPVVGIVASCGFVPVCFRKALWSALMVVSTFTVAFEGFVSET